MRSFTDEQFNMMILELTDDSHPSFDMLFSIAETSLKKKVEYWCATDEDLKDRDMTESIMQDIRIQLLKKTVTGFLFRNDGNGHINNDPDGFNKGITKVASNMYKKTAAAVRKDNYRNTELTETTCSSYMYDEDLEYKRERLAEAFDIVLDSDCKIYKVLTWLAMSLFIIKYDIKRSESSAIVVAAFSDKTLFDMRDILLKMVQKIDWITINKQQLDKINTALNAEYKGYKIGQFRYSDFFMKKGGKASISDWVNRMNRLIESRVKR